MSYIGKLNETPQTVKARIIRYDGGLFGVFRRFDDDWIAVKYTFDEDEALDYLAITLQAIKNLKRNKTCVK